MIAMIGERLFVIPRAIQMTLVSGRSIAFAAITFVVLLAFYLMLLPARALVQIA